MTFGKAILGDNQFLGVNHADQAKASALSQQFTTVDSILEVVGWAYAAGIRDFMFTTHDRLAPVLQEIAHSKLFPGMAYTPCLPYAHKYANAMAEKGMLAVIMDNIKASSKTQLLGGLVKAAAGDLGGLMQMLVHVELLMTKGLPVRGVFLQNIIFDLLLGLNATHILEKYHRYVSENLGAIPGFITMNHPAAVQVLCDEIGLRDVWLCANFNIGGFRTNPSRDVVEQSFASGKTRNIAMSVFASGAITGADTLSYVKKSTGVDAILFGSSRKANIEQNAHHILSATR
jgi:hypothetical protein